MKTNKIYLFLIFSLFAITTYAQQATEIDSKSVKLPRYASEVAVLTAIPTPTQGMLIYRTDTKSNWYYNGTAWKDMAVSSVSVPSPLYLTSTGTTISGETNQADEAGVLGINTTTGVGYAVLGKTTSTNPDENTVGVKGENMSTNDVGYGVMGRHEGTGWAGYFEGYNALKTQGNTYLNGDVGIGTDSPFGKLTVNTQSVGWNFPSLLLIDDAANNEGGAILQFRNPADKRMYLQSHFGTQSDGTDTYMTFSHNAFYNMRLRGDGNLGIGSLNPNLAGLVVNKKVGNSHAIFGDNTSGVSIESNFPGIHFNSYFNGSRKTLSTGYTSGAEMNPTNGDFSIYTSPASTTAGSTASVYERLKITKEGVVNVGNLFNLNNSNALNTGISSTIGFGGSNYSTGFISTIGTSNSAARMAFYTGYSFTGGASSMQERFTISNTGNVGIANSNPTQKLEVNGKIKIGDDFNTAVAGNVRWNSVTNDFEGFDGSGWISLTLNNNPGGWDDVLNEKQQLFDLSGISGGKFGSSLEMDGQRAIIGSSGANKAYIFSKVGNRWIQSQTLQPNDASIGDQFGHSVAINGDWAAIGAPFKTISGIQEAGKIYLFKYTEISGWVQMQTFTGSEYQENYGYNIAMGSAPTLKMLIVGSPGKTVGGNSKQGIVTTIPWDNSTDTWSSYATISAPDGGVNDRFGGIGGIDIKYNGGFFKIVVGCPFKNSIGKIYLFDAYTLASSFSSGDGISGDRFGWSVAFNQTADKVIVGAYKRYYNAVPNVGKVYVYKLNSGFPTSWSLDFDLLPSDPSPGILFGFDTKISDQFIVVGASQFQGGGKTYVFKRNGASWLEKKSLVSSDRNVDDGFGSEIAINGDDILISSSLKNINSNMEQGKVYFFSRY